MTILKCALATALLLVGCAPAIARQPATAPAARPAFADPSLSVEARLDDLLRQMTLDEKIAVLGTNPSVPRLGIKGANHVEGLHGLAQGGPGGWGRPRVIPTTTFPQAIGLSMTWNPALVRRVAAQEAYETRYIFQSPKYHQGGLVVRAPNADLGRDPRWGRTEECYGEDAFLNGTMVVSFVHGLQGDDPKYWMTSALMKHFLANSNEDDRNRTNSVFDARLFREYYAKPFEMGVREGGSRAFMTSYNSYNGIPCTMNPVVRKIAIDEWGQDGIICTDAGALMNLVHSQGAADTLEEGAALAVKAGINQFLDRYEKPVKDAVAQGLLTEKDIDERIRGVYRVMIKLGQLDPRDGNPYAAIGSLEHDPIEPWLKDEPKALVREVTRQSIVLLKNEGDLLPLDESKIRSIAIIGPRSFEVLPDWYQGDPPYAVSAIEGIRNRMRTQSETAFARRATQPATQIAGPTTGPTTALAMGQPPPAGRININFAPSDDDGGVDYHASHSDVAIVFVGNHPTAAAGWAQRTEPSYGKEAMDRASLTLEQEALVKRVRALNPRTIVVLVSSFPYAINWTQANVPAILTVTHSSQELGNAISDVLFGDYNPAGRLVQTWPKSIDDLPKMLDYDLRHGRTYMYAKPEPLYPFGFGLSYTSFKYDNVRTDGDALSGGGKIHVSVDVTNSGKRAGDEVVQLYALHVGSKVDRPIKELKGFERVWIEPGQTQTVTLDVPADRLAYWDIGRNAWSLEADDVELQVGASSADIRGTKTIHVNGQAPTTRATSQPSR